MLEQLPGAHQLKQYSFKYNPPFDITSLEGTAEQVSSSRYFRMPCPFLTEEEVEF